MVQQKLQCRHLQYRCLEISQTSSGLTISWNLRCCSLLVILKTGFVTAELANAVDGCGVWKGRDVTGLVTIEADDVEE